ncbi:MAG TPA: phenylalanine--tRNA ligase subunit beta [Candidatus Saccharimonadales bacterium]|nr:phenylalanine--tRNA ligase subunit beta [Candidatus Saccharimonadales bacterium]
MKVSLNWVKEFTSVDLPVDELVEKIGAQLGAVEEVVDIGKKYKGVLVVKVVQCEKHPNADKLHLCLVDDGGVNKKVKRDDDGLIQIVCGAPNVKAGMLAAWIPPGATVPSTVDKDPFVIEARPIRNKTSHGMLASPKELDIGDSHEGLLVLGSGKPGDEFVKTLWLDDFIVDIENKMFTHRPDCFGILGVAREISGINGKPFKSPEWYREDAKLDNDGRKNVLKLAVKNDAPELVPRFCAVAIKDIKIEPSPAWLQSFLARVGVRPINNIVDITNLVMLETGQPLHAYDYDKLKTGTLGARLSKKGEKINLLNGKELTLEDGAVVITDGQKPVGLGGIMGGADTEVDKNTKNIILEAASFDMNRTRRTAMAYGVFTDAATRFTKNQSPRQNVAALCRAIGHITSLAGGRVASQLVDSRHFNVKDTVVTIEPKFINSRLGVDLAAAQIKKLLENVEFKVSGTNELKITVPFWRTDIEIPEDVVEEVGRLYGYDKLPLALPPRDLTPAERNKAVDFKNRLRDILRAAGANEVLTYSFVHGNLMKKVDQDPKQAYQLSNALSPDLQYYRLSLTPNLLEKVHPNIRAGYDEFALFEIGVGHIKDKLNEEKLPKEFSRLALVISSKNPKSGAPYFAAKTICDNLLHEVGVHDFRYQPLSSEEKDTATTYYQEGRAATIMVGEKIIGRIGEYDQSVKRSLKLPAYTAGFELGLESLMELASPLQYSSLNRFPEVEQDFNLRSNAELPYAELTNFILQNLDELSKESGYEFSLRPLDIYQRASDDKHKQTTWRIILWHPERTMTTEETNKLLDELAARAKEKLNAERI